MQQESLADKKHAEKNGKSTRNTKETSKQKTAEDKNGALDSSDKETALEYSIKQSVPPPSKWETSNEEQSDLDIKNQNRSVQKESESKLSLIKSKKSSN